MRPAAFLRFTIAALALGTVQQPAVGEIYRCDDGGTPVFSDRPCADDARLHRGAGNLSVVAPAAGLEDIAERNREFVDQRRQRLEERRQAAAERSRQAPRRPALADHPRTYPVRHFLPVTDTRDNARRDARDRARDARARARRNTPAAAPTRDRSTLLSRSGGGGERILR